MSDATTVTILALPGFDAIALAAVPDVLRLANRCAGLNLNWTVCSLDGNPVEAACGVNLASEGRLEDAPGTSLLVVCGGRDLSGADAVATDTLRAAVAKRQTVAGFASGVAALARAGLLDGHAVAAFRQHRAALTQRFPRLRLTAQIYTCEGGRLTCAGGTAAIDLMLGWLAQRHGSSVAAHVSEILVLERVRTPDDPQPWPLADRLGTHSPAILAAARIMQAHMEQPLDRQALAREAGTTVRQLERQFARHLRMSPQRFYRELRLEHADRLMRQSDVPLTEIARQSGFQSPSHFSTVYRQRFGAPPQSQRQPFRGLPRGESDAAAV